MDGGGERATPARRVIGFYKDGLLSPGLLLARHGPRPLPPSLPLFILRPRCLAAPFAIPTTMAANSSTHSPDINEKQSAPSQAEEPTVKQPAPTKKGFFKRKSAKVEDDASLAEKESQDAVVPAAAPPAGNQLQPVSFLELFRSVHPLPHASTPANLFSQVLNTERNCFGHSWVVCSSVCRCCSGTLSTNRTARNLSQLALIASHEFALRSSHPGFRDLRYHPQGSPGSFKSRPSGFGSGLTSWLRSCVQNFGRPQCFLPGLHRCVCSPRMSFPFP